MRTQKRYSNATFTKRVDHEAGRHRPLRAQPEPRQCGTCGAVYRDRRWVAAASGPDGEAPSPSPRRTTCPACLRQASGSARGYLYLEGAFLELHRDEISRLLENEEERAVADNPLGRIMTWDQKGGRLTLTTTTEHLAQRLGHALEKAFGGSIRYRFGHEDKLARVWWRRDS